MVSRLKRSGIRSISAVVDVMNYVMLELGQPLHAFDVAKMRGGVHVRYARSGESLELLNGLAPELGPDYLVIADEEKAVALAGIMGGAATAVSDTTRDIFIESAFFAPEGIAGKSRLLGFGSDAAFRYERGVDFKLTQRALDRASELVIQICGGEAGPVTIAAGPLPPRNPVTMRLDRAERVLGVGFNVDEASAILRRLGFIFDVYERTFTVTPPSYRFDIALEEDLIEELARIHGYEKIPASIPVTAVAMTRAPETTLARSALRSMIAQLDYHEVVTYSFIDSRWEADFCANTQPATLANPIARQMSVMRSSLIPGLVDAIAFNVRHKQARVRVFEIGRCFNRGKNGYDQPMRVGGAAYGDATPEQWAEPPRRVDFFDVKGDVEALFSPRELRFEAAEHSALHPGKSARLSVGTQAVGWLGELHPRWQQKYDLPLAPVLFEIDYEPLAISDVPRYQDIPKFPPVRRDVAMLFDESVPLQAVMDTLKEEAPDIVTELSLFDVYRGRDLEEGKKSLAFRVLFQDTRKTLTDAEVESAVSKLKEVLRRRFAAKLR
jgi:phenylalanyl-tRNA synthetase beta chain